MKSPGYIARAFFRFEKNAFRPNLFYAAALIFDCAKA